MGSIGFVELDDLALDQINGGCDKKKTSCSGSTTWSGGNDDLLGPGSIGGGGTGGKTPCKKTCERERECERR